MTEKTRQLVVAQDASLSFRLSYETSLTLRDWVKEIHARRTKNWNPTLHQALKAISFRVDHGEVLGIIGSNGAGKTTLLRLVGGIYPPDTGSVKIFGRVTAILGLGVGLNPMLTGRANAKLMALFMGHSLSWIDARIEEVREFTGLGDFFDTPTRYYSTGMLSKLGFSVAMLSEPDVLLIDETLSVGDIDFKTKAAAAMAALRRRANAQMIVTHDLNFVKEACNRAIVLQSGRIVFDGPPDDAVSFYTQQ